MLSIKTILQHRALFEKNMSLRGCRIFWEDLERAYLLWCQSTKTEQKLRKTINDISEQIANIARINTTNDTKAQIAILRQMSEDFGKQLPAANQQSQQQLMCLDNLLDVIPNILDEEVPFGKDDSENVTIKEHTPHIQRANKIPHERIIDVHADIGAKISGSKFILIEGDLALLQRSLINFMLDHHIKCGYTEVYTPLLVQKQTAYNSGHLPKFSDTMFFTKEDMYLIPTSEMPLTSYYANEIIEVDQLPIRKVCYSECFRNESSSGKAFRGLLRLYQFPKVELYSFTLPEESNNEHKRKLGIAESILQQLGLRYRVVLLCAGDTGFASRKTYDLEVWLDASNAYVEIASCSNCGDFQARRANIKYKTHKKKDYVHTLNGSGVAVGRLLAAILENYQIACDTKYMTIEIPSVLQIYCNKNTMQFAIK